MSLSVADLVDIGDLDELIRRIDALCDARNWDGLVDLRDRCRAAFARGRQLWPAASHAEYRLALQAPGPWAASVLASSSSASGLFSLGPLTEVAASTHTWEDLAPHLSPSPEAALVAHERVVRGEILSGPLTADLPPVLEIPLRLERWEPAYPLATYKPYTAEFGDVPPPPAAEAVEASVGPGAEPVDDPHAVHALLELVAAWTTQSNGKARAVAVAGRAPDAIGALLPGEARIVHTAVDARHAAAVMAWAGASGGAHGRRRGMAAGRFAAWWAVAALAGELDAWPDLDEAVPRLQWYRWTPAEPSTGWELRLAAEDPEIGRAWAVEATDQV